jgi:hypothetical protein
MVLSVTKWTNKQDKSMKYLGAEAKRVGSDPISAE